MASSSWRLPRSTTSWGGPGLASKAPIIFRSSIDLLLIDHAAKLLPGAAEPGPNRAGRDTQRLRDLVVAELAQSHQQDDVTLPPRQHGQGLRQLRLGHLGGNHRDHPALVAAGRGL